MCACTHTLSHLCPFLLTHFFCSARKQTQVLRHIRHAFYHWATYTSSPLLFLPLLLLLLQQMKKPEYVCKATVDSFIYLLHFCSISLTSEYPRALPGHLGYYHLDLKSLSGWRVSSWWSVVPTLPVLGLLMIHVGRKLGTSCGWRGHKIEDMLIGLGEETSCHLALHPYNVSPEGEAERGKQV